MDKNNQIEMELDRVVKARVELAENNPDDPRAWQLVIVQQALLWAMDPGSTLSPFRLVMVPLGELYSNCMGNKEKRSTKDFRAETDLSNVV